jgi:hypothetical protein
MNPSREEALFALALTKPAAERTAWLDRECGADKALRSRLDALLAAHDQPETLLATQAPARFDYQGFCQTIFVERTDQLLSFSEK